MSCSKIPVVARVITSDFGARPVLGELLYLDPNSVSRFPSTRQILFAGGCCVVVLKYQNPGINLELLLGKLVWQLPFVAVS